MSAGPFAIPGILATIFAAALSMSGCSGSTGDPNLSAAASGPGSVSVTARTTTGSAIPSDTTASPDYLKVTLNAVDISTDGTSYQTAVNGPITVTPLDPSSKPMLTASPDTLPSGAYNALRVTVNDISWHANWVTTNPSACTGAASGSAGGTVNDAQLGNRPLYFMTPNFGGNTRTYYRTHPPLSGYVGDSDHPLLMPTPIQVFAKQTTSVNLVFDTDHILGCSRISLFNSADSGDTAPQGSVTGETSALVDASGLFEDTRQGLIGATNSGNASITLYPTGAWTGSSSETVPTRTIAGPATKMNSPHGVAFFRGTKVDGSEDEFIVANKGNNSITMYSSSATGNAAPVRTITGFQETLLNEPTGVAAYPDPAGNASRDEIWITNYGSDSVTVYNRLNSDNALPIYPTGQSAGSPIPSIAGSNTTLNEPCGIDTAPIQVTDPGTGQPATIVAFFVTNAGSDSISVYARADVTGSTDGNVAPRFTIGGSNTGLHSPCGIQVDAATNEVFVANSGTYPGFQQSSVTTYDLTALTSTVGAANNNLAPMNTLAAGNSSGLTAPTAVLKLGSLLWVADRGPQSAMSRLPDIYPSPSTSGAAAGASLSGDYNVVLYGVDLSKGITGKGYHIPTLFAERGIANFDPQGSPGPSFTLKVDTENRRTVIDRGCTRADAGGTPKKGFYDVSADGGFYAFVQGEHGSLRGAYLPDGKSFTASFYDGPDKMFVINGIKDTGATTPYLGTDGSQTADTAHYAYAAYANQILQLRRFDPTPGADIFRYQLTIGDADADHTQFDGVSLDANINTLGNPMGDFGSQQTAGVLYRPDFISLTQAPYTSHAGGQYEDQNFYYGTAGALSASGATMLFMNNTSIVDGDNCPTRLAEGMGLRQMTTGSFNTSSLKGVYFVSGFGDQFQSTTLPDLYLTESGTLTFDGNGTVQMSFHKNTQAQEIALDTTTLTYTVTTRSVPTSGSGLSASGTVNVVDMFGTDKTTPFASAFIGEDGRTLIFYRNLVEPNTGPPASANPIRLLGFALYQHS